MRNPAEDRFAKSSTAGSLWKQTKGGSVIGAWGWILGFVMRADEQTHGPQQVSVDKDLRGGILEYWNNRKAPSPQTQEHDVITFGTSGCITALGGNGLRQSR